jgi:hypothetical protein
VFTFSSLGLRLNCGNDRGRFSGSKEVSKQLR